MDPNTYLAVLTGVMTAMTLIVVFYQVLLQLRQTQLAERQTEIIEKQDEMLARRARLELSVVIRERSADVMMPPAYARLEFRLANVGKKAASDYYWHVYFPRDWSFTWEGGLIEPIHKDRIYRTGAGEFRYFAGYVDRPLHPTRSATIGSMRVPVNRLPVTLEWQAVCEDGAFPGELPGPEKFGSRIRYQKNDVSEHGE